MASKDYRSTRVEYWAIAGHRPLPSTPNPPPRGTQTRLATHSKQLRGVNADADGTMHVAQIITSFQGEHTPA